MSGRIKDQITVVTASSASPPGPAGVPADGAGELHESEELSRHLPAARRQAEGARRAERAAEVPHGPGAPCVSEPGWFQMCDEAPFSLWKSL